MRGTHASCRRAGVACGRGTHRSPCRPVGAIRCNLVLSWLFWTGPAVRRSSGSRATIFENLEAGASIDDVLAWYEGLERKQVQAVLEFTARSLDLATTER
jgi:hypothetical protein